MRGLIDELRADVRDNRAAVDYLRERVQALSVELEELRRAHNENRPALVNTRNVAQR